MRPLVLLLCGIATVAGYALRGAGWLIWHLGLALHYVGHEICFAAEGLEYPEHRRAPVGDNTGALRKERQRTESAGSVQLSRAPRAHSKPQTKPRTIARGRR